MRLCDLPLPPTSVVRLRFGVEHFAALHKLAAHYRWSAKHEQNRTVGTWERNEKGQRTKWVKTGDQPEPKLSDVFLAGYKAEHRHWTIPEHVDDLDVPNMYRLARRPQLTAEAAVAGSIAVDLQKIDALIYQLDASGEYPERGKPVMTKLGAAGSFFTQPNIPTW